MQAAICWEEHTPFEVRDDVELIGPESGEVRIEIAASGICHSDLSAWNGTLPSPCTPYVLGHEGAGTVLAVGDGVGNVSVGDHVLLFPTPVCGTCRFCLSGQPAFCLSYNPAGRPPAPFVAGGQRVYAGMGIATFCSEVVVPATHVHRITRDVPLDTVSLLGCGVMAGVGAALNVAKVEPGSSVVVIGAGGVGTSVIQGARIAGAAEIVVIDKVEAKREWASGFGATHVGRPEDLPDLIEEVTDGIGFDYAFEVVGRSETIRSTIDAARRGGVAVIVGAGRMDDYVRLNAFEFIWGGKEIRGVTMGGTDPRTDFDRLIRLWRAGLLDLDSMITRRIKLSEINDAFEAVERGEVIRVLVEF